MVFEKGINLVDNNVFKSDYQKAWFKSNGIEGFQAEYFNNPKLEGSPVLVRSEDEINFRWGDGEQIADSIIARNFSIRWTSVFTPEISGEYTFSVMGDDWCRLFIDGEKKAEAGTRGAYYTFRAEKGKSHKVTIEYSQKADNAEVKFDMGYFEQASPATIASCVKDADAIIFVGGISAKLEGEEMPVEIDGFKGGDRTNIGLPKIQTELMKALKSTGKPIVFVNMSGSAIGFEWEAQNIPAIIQAWYGGQAGGTAIADVLFGDYNPAGRLPVTFYKSVSDLPDFEDYSMENRTYRYFKGEPLYPFGYGLSYTSFTYDNLEMPDTLMANSNLNINVDVSDTGAIDGDEVVQLYVTNKSTGYRSPICALKGFQRIHLKTGETKKVSFNLCSSDLSVIDSQGKVVQVEGELIISVGGGQPTSQFINEKKILHKEMIVNSL